MALELHVQLRVARVAACKQLARRIKCYLVSERAIARKVVHSRPVCNGAAPLQQRARVNSGSDSPRLFIMCVSRYVRLQYYLPLPAWVRAGSLYV